MESRRHFSSSAEPEGSEGADAAKAPSLAAMAAAALTFASNSLGIDTGGGGGMEEGGAKGLYASGGGDGGDTRGAMVGAWGCFDIARRRRYASSPGSVDGRIVVAFETDSPAMSSLSLGMRGAVGCGGLRWAVNARRRW